MAQERRYDLPLTQSAGSGFLTLLISLMTFLAVLSLAASFALSAMTERWSSGLENRMTVEVPAQDQNGAVLSRGQVRETTDRIASMLSQHPAIAEYHVLSNEEINELIKPWLGGDILVLNDAPLPGLISVEVKKDDDQAIAMLGDAIRNISMTARLDTHQSWLEDVLRFTGAMKFAALILIIVIGITTATAVAGGVRARMAVHREEVEILHLMGAADRYISRQFQRHSMILALKGSGMGLAGGVVALLIINWLTGQMGIALLPDFRLSLGQMIVIAALPIMAGIIAIISSDRTVKAVLGDMA